MNEHFRSASEIIAFSNSQFYDDQLVPLRLPKKSERISPSIVDVKVQDGKKEGKTNVKEAEEIVRRVEAIVTDSTCGRSIGIISLLGNEQSRLIRGRLLDAIGPHLMARHDVLVGDPPAFQGAERDSMYTFMIWAFAASTLSTHICLQSKLVVDSNLPFYGMLARQDPYPEPTHPLSAG